MKMKLSNPLLSRPRLFLLNVGAILTAFSVTSTAVADENTYNIVAAAKVEVEAQGCDYLGEVWGAAGGKLSKWNRYSTNSSRHKAEDKALKMAAERNATHIVWRNILADRIAIKKCTRLLTVVEAARSQAILQSKEIARAIVSIK